MPVPLPLPALLAAIPLAVEAGAAGSGAPQATAAVQAGAPFAWSLVLPWRRGEADRADSARPQRRASCRGQSEIQLDGRRR